MPTFLREKLSKIKDRRSSLQKAIDWVKAYRLPSNGIIVHHNSKNVTPEVTGYLIPTMLNAGEKEFAYELAEWEVSVQQPDGSFLAPDNVPYTFDTAQVLRGFLAVVDEIPQLKTNIKRACDYIVSQIDDEGEVHTPAYHTWTLPDQSRFSTYCNLYVLYPLLQAGRQLGEQKYAQAAMRSLAFYKRKLDLTEFKTEMGTLSHIFGYMMEALVELNEIDLVKKGLEQVAGIQMRNGAIPAYPGAHWICSTGVAQLAIAGWKIGQKELARKALQYLEKVQNPSGGFYGSYGYGAKYFPNEEISWANKFFIDLYLLVRGNTGQAADLSPQEWGQIWSRGIEPEKVAKNLSSGTFLPWTEVLRQYTQDSKQILDLGSGRGEHSAVLALSGKEMTLLEWSQENIDFSKKLFDVLGKKAEFFKRDIRDPLPFTDSSFDTVFSCGVMEYFSDEQIINFLKEAFRVARKRVIIMVPNALSMLYRVGMWHMKKSHNWPWGEERQFSTLRPYFFATHCTLFKEFSVSSKHSLNFLTMPGGRLLQKLIRRGFDLKDHSNPAFLRQGYLLVSIGEKA